MSMYNARVNFSLRTHMFKCKMNFMNDPAYKAEMWRCNSCETCIDSQSHILYCPAYKELREGKSLTSDDDVVNYFREVMKIRTKLELNKWGICRGESIPCSVCQCMTVTELVWLFELVFVLVAFINKNKIGSSKLVFMHFLGWGTLRGSSSFRCWLGWGTISQSSTLRVKYWLGCGTLGDIWISL